MSIKIEFPICREIVTKLQMAAIDTTTSHKEKRDIWLNELNTIATWFIKRDTEDKAVIKQLEMMVANAPSEKKEEVITKVIQLNRERELVKLQLEFDYDDAKNRLEIAFEKQKIVEDGLYWCPFANKLRDAQRDKEREEARKKEEAGREEREKEYARQREERRKQYSSSGNNHSYTGAGMSKRDMATITLNKYLLAQGQSILSLSSTKEEVLSARKGLVRHYHPDIVGALGLVAMQEINNAVDILTK